MMGRVRPKDCNAIEQQFVARMTTTVLAESSTQ